MKLKFIYLITLMILGYQGIVFADTPPTPTPSPSTPDTSVYLRGLDQGGAGGHAWVCDGSMIIMETSSTTIAKRYVHCNWGWGGSGNGYFDGDVLEVSLSSFEPAQYFAVKLGFDL